MLAQRNLLRFTTTTCGVVPSRSGRSRKSISAANAATNFHKVLSIARSNEPVKLCSIRQVAHTHRHSNFSAFVQINLCWLNWRIFRISLTAKMPMLTASRTVRLGKTRGFRKPAWKASAWASTYTRTDGRTTRKHNAFDLIYPKGRGTSATSSP